MTAIGTSRVIILMMTTDFAGLSATIAPCITIDSVSSVREFMEATYDQGAVEANGDESSELGGEDPLEDPSAIVKIVERTRAGARRSR
jgi:hypothetical protein